MINILSLGGGVQSVALFHLARLNIIESFDYVIFADTHSEPQFVYDHLEYLKQFQEIVIVSTGDLKESNHLHIPAFVVNDFGKAVPMFRQCTDRYKIRPINKWIKQNVKGNYRIAIGISIDEQHRASFNKSRHYPLIDLDMNRADCISFLRKNNIMIPNKSSCVFCPYHSNNYWRDLKNNHPIEFQKAVDYEKQMNEQYAKKVGKPIFLHMSGKELSKVDFSENQRTMFDNFVCEGGCGV